MMTELLEAWQAPATLPLDDTERALIESTIRDDYYGGWFEGDAARMARAIHPALAKRALDQDRTRSAGLWHTTADEMIVAAGAGNGRARVGNGRVEITVHHAGGGIATATALADHYVDYLHLVRTPDGWRIINALWRWADGHGPRRS